MKYLPVVERWDGELRRDEFWLNCPWHIEDRPSLSVNLHRGGFNCFGCKKHGFIVDLVAAVERVSMSKAQDIVDSKRNGRGASLPIGRGTLGQTKTLYLDRETSIELFMPIQSKKYKDYIKSRKIPLTLVKEYDLREGSTIKRGWQNRVIYSISDLTGGLVSLEGRAIDNREPKYFKWKDSDASAGIFGIDKIKQSDYKNPLFIVEGMFDCLAVVSQKFNAIAMACSDLSDKQLNQLKKKTRFPVVILDGVTPKTAKQRDEVRRAIKKNLAKVFPKYKICEIPFKGKDPNDLLKEKKLKKYLMSIV
jgi:DNA primase